MDRLGSDRVRAACGLASARLPHDDRGRQAHEPVHRVQGDPHVEPHGRRDDQRGRHAEHHNERHKLSIGRQPPRRPEGGNLGGATIGTRSDAPNRWWLPLVAPLASFQEARSA